MSTIALNRPEVQPIAPEWIGQAEPTPVDLLIEPGLDTIADWLDESEPDHYTTVCDRFGRVISTDRPRYEARELELGWIVWDEMRQETTHWFPTGQAAKDKASDLDAEDFEPLLIGGLPWFEAAAACEHFDGWKVTPTRI
jgi:hypothetical protein